MISPQTIAKWSLANHLLDGCRIHHPTSGLVFIREVENHLINFRREDNRPIPGFSTEEFIKDFKKLLFDEDYGRLSDKYLEEINNKKFIEDGKKKNAFAREAVKDKLKKARLKKYSPIKNYMKTYILLLKDFQSSFPDKVNIIPRGLDKRDEDLVKTWSNKEGSRNSGSSNRLKSARAAELVTAEYFRLNKKHVEDISITQIENNNDGEWRNYDLLVNNTPIDVKNTRRSKINPNHFVSFHVPRFKESRDNAEVIIAGVISPFDVFDNFTEVTFLGLASLSKLNIISKYFTSDFVTVKLERSAFSNSSLLPLWLFNYPKELYANQIKHLQNLCEISLPDLSLWQETRRNILPAYLSSNKDIPGLIMETYNEHEKTFLFKLESSLSSLGRSLPVLYLCILNDYLSRCNDNILDEFDPKIYRKIVFPSSSSKKYQTNAPLFLYDPFETVDALIDCLCKLNSRKANVKEYKYFKLTSPNILRAKRENEDASWETLIAYCGGTIPAKYGYDPACGNTPLVFGDAEVCQVCGKLICPKCDFCSDKCSRPRRSF